jgi:hypothetical protein
MFHLYNDDKKIYFDYMMMMMIMKHGGDKLALWVQDWAYQRGNQNPYIEEQTTTYKSRKSVWLWNEEQRYKN